MKAFAISLLTLANLNLYALQPDDNHQENSLEEIVVISKNEQVDAAEVLNQSMIDEQTADTLGALLMNTPGIANASFGPGVGRPVIRGLAGTQVGIFTNGLAVQDVSAASPDHATMIDPSDASRIDILQGPESLFYAGGHVGGIVNITKKRIHEAPLSQNQGNLSTSFSSNNQGKLIKGATDVGTGNWILHMEGFSRKTDNYSSGQGDVANSDTQGAGGNIALSYADAEQGFIGISISQLDYNYAIPNPENEDTRIKPKSTDVTIRGEYRFTESVIHSWATQLAYTDYAHKEYDEGMAEAYFKKQSGTLKSWVEHDSIIGLTGKFGLDMVYQDNELCHSHEGCNNIPHYNEPWDGRKGDHFDAEHGYDFTHETPMPATKTYDYGLFLIETTPWSQGTINAGIRVDYRQITSDPITIEPDTRQGKSYYNSKDFFAMNASLEGLWNINRSHSLSLTLAHSERAPDAEELFYNGEHHATFSYQLDNPNLNSEKANTLNMRWSFTHRRLATSLNVFYYDFDGFIYNALQPFTQPESDHEHDHDHEHEHAHEHSNPVYRYAQAGATLTGAEFVIDTQPFKQLDAFHLNFFADTVHAQLKKGVNKNLPRIPPASFGLSAIYQTERLLLQTDIRSFLDQNDVAKSETKTEGYSTLNLQGRYNHKIGRNTGWIALKGNNLTNQYGENAVSYLKRYAPVMGRNVVFEVGINI